MARWVNKVYPWWRPYARLDLVPTPRQWRAFRLMRAVEAVAEAVAHRFNVAG